MPPKRKKNFNSDRPIVKIYNPHTKNNGECIKINEDNDWRYGSFIDVGTRNLAIRFSRGNMKSKKIETIDQVKFDCDLAKQKVAQKKKLGEKCQIGINNDKYSVMLSNLYDCEEYFINCQYILIEEQVEGIATYNVMAMNMIVMALMAIVRNKGNLPIIIIISNKIKSVNLGAPRGMPKKDLKAWCGEKSLDILRERLRESPTKEDIILYDNMFEMKKLDDDGDIVCYCKVWWEDYIFTGLIDRKYLETYHLKE